MTLKSATGIKTTGPVKIFDLSRHRELFRDDAALDQFVGALLTKVVSDGVTVLTKGESSIALLTPATDAREAFQLRIAAKLAENPDVVKELEERAKDGRFTEYGTFDVPDNT